MAETPTAAGGNSAGSASAPAVTDRRPVPRGVLPKGVQAWVMAGLALGMLAIMLIVGRPEPPARPAGATAPAPAPSADRVRDYQDRLRAVEALRDRVNQHYLSTFGAAAAVGLISGLSQYLGSAGLARGDGDRTIVIAGGVGDATSQATLQVMSRFLNRLPTITIREGHRVKVYLTGDLELPAYSTPGGPGSVLKEDAVSRRILLSCVVLLLMVGSASAQLAVVDPANLVQATLIARRMQQHYEELRAQYLTVLRMAQRLGNTDGYRIPTIPITSHDVGRWEYGRPWIQALNSGDATGSAYLSTTLPVLRPTVTPARLTAEARRALERQYATIEITDSVAMMGGHQVALARGYHGQLQQAVQALEGDVLNGLQRYHEMTAILDKIAGGELLARRQDMLANQLLSHALEQLLARGKRLRDTEAAQMNMQLVTWRDAHTANHAFVAGTGDALRTWRQP